MCYEKYISIEDYNNLKDNKRMILLNKARRMVSMIEKHMSVNRMITKDK